MQLIVAALQIIVVWADKRALTTFVESVLGQSDLTGAERKHFLDFLRAYMACLESQLFAGICDLITNRECVRRHVTFHGLKVSNA